MKIAVEIETMFDVGDKVYVIHEVPVHNNLYRDEAEWRAKSKNPFERKPGEFNIDSRVIKQDNRETIVRYEVNYRLYDECDIFSDLDSALIECSKRNSDSN